MRARLQAFPSADGEFLAFARESLAGLDEPVTPEALQGALRARYPAAIVTVQDELARHEDDPVVWYAFRMGAVLHAEALPDTEPPAAWQAWAILDDDRRFLEVSPELATIAEVPAEIMLGRPVEAFSNPSDPTIREDIGRLWVEFLRRRELSSTLRFNFRNGRPREVAYHLRGDADGPGRHRLSVRELPR